mmetsp:Transcript_28515/g.47892  ORF Transcript_28515/g.47892 Transcript_28515/m.47892 type:complete len:169 (-) Transcript_28515:307-813(-)
MDMCVAVILHESTPLQHTLKESILNIEAAPNVLSESWPSSHWIPFHPHLALSILNPTRNLRPLGPLSQPSVGQLRSPPTHPVSYLPRGPPIGFSDEPNSLPSTLNESISNIKGSLHDLRVRTRPSRSIPYHPRPHLAVSILNPTRNLRPLGPPNQVHSRNHKGVHSQR